MPLSLRSFRSLLLLPCLALVASARAVQPDTPSLDRYLPPRVERVYKTLARAFSGDRAMEVVTLMSRGWRLPGNPAFEASQDAIARRLEAAGFRMATSGPSPARQGTSVADRQPQAPREWYEQSALSTPAWEPVAASLRIFDATSPASGDLVLDMGRPLDRVSLCINSFSTPDGGIRAPLVSVGGGGEAADYAAIDVRGKIVLGEADTRRLFDMAVRQRGAAGVLSAAVADYNRPDETPDVVQWSGIPYDEKSRTFGFKISRRLASRLKERLAAGPVALQADISTRFDQHPDRTLVAEIPGRTAPDQRVVLVAHVQEPGANDNASGCATLLEIARTLAEGIARGAIPPPARTITFLWGTEIAASRQWLAADASRAASVVAAFSLDMTGENVAMTGGTFLIEKQPDPSAVWARPSDPHTEWGRGSVAAGSLKGHLLNDLHLAVCQRRARDTGWVVKANPYEGGSDHSVFLAARIPALLDWHFTDRYYHTNLDTPDKTSPAEMANVAVAVGTTAWLLASADEQDASAIAGLVEQAAIARLSLERRQAADTVAHATTAEAKATEEAVFGAWKKWYVEALESVETLPVGGVSGASKERIARAKRRVGEVRRP